MTETVNSDLTLDQVTDAYFYVVHDVTIKPKKSTLDSVNEIDNTPTLFHTVSNFHKYGTKQGPKSWRIRFKKTDKKEFPEISVDDPMVLLGALVSNYQVRSKKLGNHIDGEFSKTVGPKNNPPDLRRPSELLSIVWNGVDIKAVFGQDHFVDPDPNLTEEQFRLIGLEAQKKINEWVANGGPTMGTAIETIKGLQAQFS